MTGALGRKRRLRPNYLCCLQKETRRGGLHQHLLKRHQDTNDRYSCRVRLAIQGFKDAPDVLSDSCSVNPYCSYLCSLPSRTTAPTAILTTSPSTLTGRNSTLQPQYSDSRCRVPPLRYCYTGPIDRPLCTSEGTPKTPDRPITHPLTLRLLPTRRRCTTAAPPLQLQDAL